jgi:hypothetical protein
MGEKLATAASGTLIRDRIPLMAKSRLEVASPGNVPVKAERAALGRLASGRSSG